MPASVHWQAAQRTDAPLPPLLSALELHMSHACALAWPATTLLSPVQLPTSAEDKQAAASWQPVHP